MTYRLELLTSQDSDLLHGMRRLMTESRDWARDRPRELNAERFRDEIKVNRRVKGWIKAGNVWMDGRMTVRDPYGATDIRLHACDKLYNPGGEYCEVLGHYACDECWRMTQKKCAEAELPSADFEVLARDRPLSAPWKVIAGRKKALKARAVTPESRKRESRSGSSKLDKILNETNISEKLLEEQEKRSVFLTETPVHEEEVKVEEVKKERYVFKNPLELMCPPLMSIHQARAEDESGYS